jgi:hypothetical protein
VIRYTNEHFYEEVVCCTPSGCICSVVHTQGVALGYHFPALQAEESQLSTEFEFLAFLPP